MDPYIGEIRLFAGNYAPKGWLLCRGQELVIQNYRELFSVIGTTYGGDGKQYFNLLDLRGCVPLSCGLGDGTLWNLGDKGGEAEVVLSLSEMPAHLHIPRSSSTPDNTMPPGRIWANAGIGKSGVAAYTEIASMKMSPDAISAAGAGKPHNNMQPYLALNYIIAYDGYLPRS
jgi:microcystin-dependent protein